MTLSLRVWHIPQVPMKPFYVEVNSLVEAKIVLDALARYDIFQFDNNVKGDYANAAGVEINLPNCNEWVELCPDDLVGLHDALERVCPNLLHVDNFMNELSLEQIRILDARWTEFPVNS